MLLNVCPLKISSIGFWFKSFNQQTLPSKCMYTFWVKSYFFRGICEQGRIYHYISGLVPRLAKAYKYVFDLACNNDTLFKLSSENPSDSSTKAREFFGLRDFYRFGKIFSDCCYS